MNIDRIDAIKSAFAAEQISKPLAVKFEDIPVSYEAITADWLTAVICRGHPGAVVTEFKLGERDSGSSNRRRIFLSYNEAGKNAGLPASVFCKAAHDLVTRILCSSGMTHSEVTFYNKIRPTLDIESPECLLARYDPVSFNSIIILKDLGDKVTYCSHKTISTRESVESQLDLMAKMHGQFYNSPLFEGPLSDILTFHYRFTNLCLKHRFAECCDNGFVAGKEVIPPALFARREEVWPATLLSVERHKDTPHTLNHGDVHLKNWYMTHDGRMGLGDWQVTCRGHWSRDLAYTISTALQSEDRLAWEQDLIRYYLKKFQEYGGPAVSFEEAWKDYRQQMLSVLAWWTVTLTPSSEMPDMQPLDTTLEFLRRIAVAMHEIGSLDAFD